MKLEWKRMTIWLREQGQWRKHSHLSVSIYLLEIYDLFNSICYTTVMGISTRKNKSVVDLFRVYDHHTYRTQNFIRTNQQHHNLKSTTNHNISESGCKPQGRRNSWFRS